VTLAPGNVQDRARAARYAALAEWAQEQGLDAVLTAHHADDQAETLLMRLNRGSGVSGLSAVRAFRPLQDGGVAVARPLLDWRKAELEEIVAAAGLTPARDPANVDPRFDRARIRAQLEEADWLDPLAIARSAQLLAQADEAIEWMIAQVWGNEVERVEDGFRWAETDRPHLVTLGIAERAIAACGGSGAGLAEVARLLAEVRSGNRANLAGVLVSYRAGVWTFAPEPPRR
jgi:tRNA(Ile)-lysidine synthase